MPDALCSREAKSPMINVNHSDVAQYKSLMAEFTELHRKLAKLKTINNINTEGIYKLLKDGATMVTKGDDVLNALKEDSYGFNFDDKQKKIAEDAFQTLMSVTPFKLDKMVEYIDEHN